MEFSDRARSGPRPRGDIIVDNWSECLECLAPNVSTGSINNGRISKGRQNCEDRNRSRVR